MATSHGDILAYYDLDRIPTNQDNVKGGIICGFILSGGYFANRRQASRHVVTTHTTLTKKRLLVEDPCFNSEMIDWYAVRCNIDTGRYKKAEQFDVDKVWGIQELTEAL